MKSTPGSLGKAHTDTLLERRGTFLIHVRVHDSVLVCVCIIEYLSLVIGKNRNSSHSFLDQSTGQSTGIS